MLALLVRGKRRPFSAFTTVAIICMLLLCRVLQAVGVLTQHLVTQEELTLNFILEVYCYVYVLAELFTSETIISAWKRLGCFSSPVPITNLYTELHEEGCKQSGSPYYYSGSQDISALGSLLAVQLILTAQLQNTFETPFLGILTLLFGTRAFLKFMNFTLKYTALVRNSVNDYIVTRKLFFLCVDTFTLACVFELAVRISARNQTEYASTATAMLFIIVLGGAFLHTVINYWNQT
jgi:hypothetical protein